MKPPAIYLRVAEGRIARTIEAEPLVLFDVDKDGNLLGIEILLDKEALENINAPADWYRCSEVLIIGGEARPRWRVMERRLRRRTER